MLLEGNRFYLGGFKIGKGKKKGGSAKRALEVSSNSVELHKSRSHIQQPSSVFKLFWDLLKIFIIMFRHANFHRGRHFLCSHVSLERLKWCRPLQVEVTGWDALSDSKSLPSWERLCT